VLPPTPGEAKKKPLHMPVRLGLLGGNGQDIDLTLASGKRLEDGVIEVTKRTETYRFRDVPSRPVPSLLRGFSAPVNLTIAHSDADLQFLMANDSDLYNRWQAAQDYATRVLVAAVKALRAGTRPAKPQAYVAALGVTLNDESLDPGYRAQFMFLPSESDLARIIGRDVDPLAIHNARQDLRKAVGTMLYDALVDTYRKYEIRGP
jgi:aminopeptidase N